MRQAWLAFAFGLTGGINLMIALHRRNEDLSDWLGPALLAVAMLGVGARAASKKPVS